MLSTFTDDVIHYFVDHSKVESVVGLTNYWARVAPITLANWQRDHAVVQGDEVVIEWSTQRPENRALWNFDYQARGYRTK